MGPDLSKPRDLLLRARRSGLRARGGAGELALPFPRLALPSFEGLALPLPRVASSARAGRIALGSIGAIALLLVTWAAAAPSVLVPGSQWTFPHWFSGPLHGLFGHLVQGQMGLSLGLTGVVLVMSLAYAVVLASIRHLSLRLIVVTVVAANVIILMSPPLQLTDVFNYLGYARLGALHHLNPYTHVIAHASHDPVFRFGSWHNLKSPYGPAFTALSYPLAFLPIPVAYWVFKVTIVLASLGLTAIVWQIARQLDRDPRFAVAFVALNPIVIIYAVGGFHNDFFMLIPALGAVSLMLARRDKAAGAALALAVAVKFTAILLLPFLLLGARPVRRRAHLVLGLVLGAIPLVAMSLALFGTSLPNLSDQSTLLTNFSIPNLVGLVIGAGGGAPMLLRIANVLVVVAVAWLIRRRGDWLTGAGWATLALIASLAWLVPWYITWLLPIAALARNARLRRATLALTAFLVLSFVPATGIVLSDLHIDTMGGSAGQASAGREQYLEHGMPVSLNSAPARAVVSGQ